MLEPEEHRTRNMVVRVKPSELRRFDAAADVAGVSRSRVVREGARRVAREILREAATEDPEET